jgi:hypothetical protein
MGNVLDKRCEENQNTHFTSNKFFSENRANVEVKNIVKPSLAQMTI